jgi:hypothetical protein
MNRSVMDRQMFRNGGYVRQMQMGGDPMMAPPMGGDQMMAPPMAGPAPQGMPPAPSVAGMPVPADASMDQAAAGAMQQGIDPAMLESMLQQAAGQFGNLDAAAETEDYEQVMNVIRGDQASLQDRRQELAGVVGDADAAQTPDSVLTLVQPIMQLAAVDQGIGGLAPETMNTPVTGDMAGGIMSTVNMGAEEQPMPGQGGPAPVNFNQGGAVQYMQPGGVALPAETPAGGRLGELYQDRQALYSQILGPQNQQQEREDQRNMTKAQMLFDIAQGGLAFASGAGMPGRSPAEQLAAAFVQPLGNISARAGEFQQFKQGQKRDERALALQALGAAEADFSAEKKSAADAAAAAAERTWKTAENAQSRAYELLKMDKQFAFTKQENETSMNFQERLADRKLAMQRTLQELTGSQSQADIQLRGQLQVELAQLNNQFTRSLQQDRFDFTTVERVATQDYNDSVFAQKFANDKAILALQGAQDRASIKLRQQLEQENLRLGSELRKGEYMLQFENQLKRDGILNTYELERMDRGQDFNLALATHKGAIAREAQTFQNAFTAAESVLDRAQREKLQLSDQAFRQLMQQEMQKFTSEQAEIDRGIANVNRYFDEKLAQRGADRADKALTLQEAAQALDEAYKFGKLSLDQLAAKAVKVGSEAKTDQLQFITDPDRLSKYANDTLGKETALFEQALLDYLKPTSTWNGSAFVQDATPELARQIRSTLDARKAAGFEVPSVPGYSPKEVGAGSAGQQPPEMPSNPDSPEFKQGLYSPQTGVNYDSPLWQKIPTNIVDPEIAYQRSTGPGEIPTRISNWVNEWGRELLGLPPMSAENRELVTADKDMNTLREVINTEIINWASEDRVLKASQDSLRSLTQDLTPGAFKSDEAVSSTLDSIKGNLGRAFERYALIDPEYNPQAQGRYSEQQVLGARSRANAIRSLMAEVIAMENVFNSYLDGLRGGGPASATLGDMNADKAAIMEMLRQNQGGEQ